MKPIITAAALLLAGCDPAPQAEYTTEAIEAGRRIDEERQQREKAEAQLSEEKATTSFWQFAALLAASAAGLSVIVGAVLGSSARKDAEH